MSIPLDLTIAIPAKNEEANLLKCLTCVGKNFAKKVVVIDSESSDNTTKIAEDFNVEVVPFCWNGLFPKKRNWFLRNYDINTEWILFLDADEYLTETFKEEMRKTLPGSNKAGYWLNYSIYFLGKQLRGGYPLKKLALFRVGAGEYEQIDEQSWSHLDMEVHEHPVLKGEIGIIKSKIDHKDYKGMSHYVTKHNEYASWEAKRFLQRTTEAGARTDWTWKQRLKYSLMNNILIAPVYFLGSFFLLGGFRDGIRGFAFAIFKMSYFTQVYCKIQEYRNMDRIN